MPSPGTRTRASPAGIFEVEVEVDCIFEKNNFRGLQCLALRGSLQRFESIKIKVRLEHASDGDSGRMGVEQRRETAIQFLQRERREKDKNEQFIFPSSLLSFFDLIYSTRFQRCSLACRPLHTHIWIALSSGELVAHAEVESEDAFWRCVHSMSPKVLRPRRRRRPQPNISVSLRSFRRLR